jgi:predicted small lipoprotein YifL
VSAELANDCKHAFRMRCVLYFPDLCGIGRDFIVLTFMRVNHLFLPVILAMLAQACGQTGPLYLPSSKPPIHVPKDLPVEEQ